MSLETGEDSLPSLMMSQRGPVTHPRNLRHCGSLPADEGPLAVPSHPLKVKPAGNAYASEANIKCATGLFFILPDELTVSILEYLGPTTLLQLGSTCKAFFAFSRLEELWKTLCIEYVFPFWLRSCFNYLLFLRPARA